MMKRSPETSLAQINAAIDNLRPTIEIIVEDIDPAALHELILVILEKPLNLYDIYQDKLQDIDLDILEDEEDILNQYNQFKFGLRQAVTLGGFQLDILGFKDTEIMLDPMQDLAADSSLSLQNLGASFSTICNYWLWYEIARACQKRELTEAEKHNDKGYEYTQAGDYHNALVEFEKATDHSPGFHLAWINTGIAIKNLGDFDKAIEQYDYVIDNIDKNYKKAWHNKAIAFLHKEDLEEALACCNKALEIDPFYVVAAQLRDELQGQLDAPLPMELLGAAPWRRAEAHITEGVYALQAGNLKRASAHLKSAIKLRYEADSNPFNSMACEHLVGLAHYNLGLTYATEGQGCESQRDMIDKYESAKAELEKAISIGEHVSEFQPFVSDAHHYIKVINGLIANDEQ
jgi:tetratricopeptide (TPR) repeat protein